MVLTFKDDSPGGEESLEQGDTGELRMLPKVLIQTGNKWLNGQVCKTVSCCCKNIGDGGVYVGIVARVTAKLCAHGIVTHDVWQIVPEYKCLRETETKALKLKPL